MHLTPAELRSVQRERLRALLSLLEFTPPGRRHDELLEQTRATVAAIRHSHGLSDASLVGRSARVSASDSAGLGV